MTLNQRLFILVPLVSLLCNVFLFLTVLGAKKNRLIYAFMELLGVFTAWCAGSLFMRMTVYPGPAFWYEVSIMGIFLVPFFIYNFIYCFTDAKGSFVRSLLFGGWLVMAALNLFHVFITQPQVLEEAGERRFEYGVSPALIVPVLLAVLTIWAAWRLAYRSVKEGRVLLSQFMPMIVGVAVMFLCTVAAALPQMVSLPIDTFSCGVNAVCLYFALYKKRLVELHSFASNGPAYWISAIFTTLLLITSYEALDRLYSRYFPAYLPYQTIVFAVSFSLLTMAVYHLVRRLMANLFVKGKELREAELKEFSSTVNKTLQLSEVLELYCDFLQRNLPGRTARVYLRVPETGAYRMEGSTNTALAKGREIAADHPLLAWLSQYGHGVSYAEFRRTKIYRSLWESEKRRFDELRVDFILPVINDNSMVAVTLFSEEELDGKSRDLAPAEVTFLESMTAVLAMALKNAALYAAIENKARRDPLTNLYNRSYFEECIRRDFELCLHDQMALMIISFDDFHLYNELYGTSEGDRILRCFADALQALAGHKGTVARYSGKEFALSFPFCAAATALDCAEAAKAWLNQELTGGGERIKKFLTFSAGISAYPVSASSVEELFTYAGMAVYSAKTAGKNKIVLYQPESEEQRSSQSLINKRTLAENCAATIYALTAAIDAKDHYTFSHSNHVSEYAAALAEALDLGAEHVEIIRQAGLLHDIGKIGIPEGILSKTDRLTQEEYEIMKQHVEGSIAMIRYLPSLDYVIPSAIGHHERWDGRGYPRGISGEAIPIGARCLCIADSFDAMVSKRSYKEAMQVADALEEIRRNLGTQFDPRLGALFIQLVEGGKITVHTESA